MLVGAFPELDTNCRLINNRLEVESQGQATSGLNTKILPVLIPDPQASAEYATDSVKRDPTTTSLFF